MPNPQIGIFWIHPVSLKLIIYSEPISSVKTEVGFKTGSYDHCDMWLDVQRKHPELIEQEYDEIDRGRIVYDNEKDKFYVYSNSEVISKHSSNIIMNFTLPKDRTKFIFDEHYVLTK